ncbi:hypothetical protein KQI08_06495 [Paraeggerthella hongkongensis]|uniref:hypothetical protein n=1 Tax=Paraeggerthella hominis TaxID=2897351 RepID=UPI001C11F16F|nr:MULTISPECIES: hypothetical protein [Paraeggerthella]MBU5405564.1 hypothetical protein [Paraeggerthella hongkongensis]MCD2432616.1 hypothetical protein [Paraeggerthella hominis]
MNDEKKSLEAPAETPPVAPKRPRKPVLIAMAAAAAVAIAGGAALACALGGPAETADPPSNQQSQAAASSPQKSQSAVKLTVRAEGADGSATKAKVVAVGKDKKTVIAEREVEANKAVEIGKLAEGEYELIVTCAPVTSTGSAFKLPEKPTAFKVDGKGKAVEVEVKLEALPEEEMTKEQLEAVATILEASGNAEAAKNVVAKAETAPSVPGSGDSVQTTPPAPSGGNNGGGSSGNNSNSSGGGTGNGGSGNGGGATPAPTPTPTPDPTPQPPAHQHDWVAQYETVTIPAVTEQRWVENWIYVNRYTCGHCGTHTYSYSEAQAHQDMHWEQTGTIYGFVTSGYEEDRGYYETVVVSPERTEQRLTGYVCSGCGQWK